MARALADLLGVNTPDFHLGLRELERAGGAPRADIRLMVDIEREVRGKLRQLGLDPVNTTGEELYHALGQRLRRDEQQVRTALKASDASPVELLQKIASYLTAETNSRTVFVVKPSAMKNLLKKLKPKLTMKALGYRSMDSMFKHEPVAQLLAATLMFETEKWQTTRLAAYRRLSPSDFELRKAQYIVPTGKKWPEIAKRYTAVYRHNVLAVGEVGGILLLPLEEDLDALAITAVALSIRAYNTIRSTSAWLKLQQVQPDYGSIFVDCMQGEPLSGVSMGSKPLTWRMVHWLYGIKRERVAHPRLFEPHLQSEDFEWHRTGAALAHLHDSLDFWRGSHLLGYCDRNQVVSLNVLDVALAVCNKIAFGTQALHHMREALGRELVARYLCEQPIHDDVLEKLSSRLTPEFDFDA